MAKRQKPEYIFLLRGVARHVGGERKPFELHVSAHSENHASYVFWNSCFAPSTINGKVRTVRLTSIRKVRTASE
jgi:hypothetical protein